MSDSHRNQRMVMISDHGSTKPIKAKCTKANKPNVSHVSMDVEMNLSSSSATDDPGHSVATDH